EPPATRAILVERLEGALEHGVQWNAVPRLDPSYQELLSRNIDLLLHEWFQKMVDAYHALAADQRAAYVDAQLNRLPGGDRLNQAQTAVAALSDAPPPSGAKRNAVAWLLAKVRRWTAQSSAEQRQRVDEFVAAVQARWLLRQMPKLLGG